MPTSQSSHTPPQELVRSVAVDYERLRRILTLSNMSLDNAWQEILCLEIALIVECFHKQSHVDALSRAMDELIENSRHSPNTKSRLNHFDAAKVRLCEVSS